MNQALVPVPTQRTISAGRWTCDRTAAWNSVSPGVLGAEMIVEGLQMIDLPTKAL